MAATPSTERVDQLDGLRGIAIVLVIINHLRLGPIFALAPSWLHPFLAMFTASGKIAVSILFLLSGYLMARVYPQIPSYLSFLQKRYTRIFPAFITMCTALAIVRYFWLRLDWISITGIVLLTIFLAGNMWLLLQKSAHRRVIGKNLFRAFLSIQIFTALAYIFVLSAVPAAVFYQIWQNWLKEIVYFVVNATMTLPLGTYVPQLDGVYWSVLTEVGLYLLYPVFFLPVAVVFQSLKQAWQRIFLLALCVPFFFGLSLLAKSVLGLQMLQVHLSIYFACGVMIGFLRSENWVQKLQQRAAKIPGLLLTVLCLAAVIGSPVFVSRFTLGFEMDTILWTIPVMLMFLTTLASTNAWSTLLQSRPLVYLGQRSYSYYLTHTIAIEMFVKMSEPKNLIEVAAVAIPSLIMTLMLGWFLHEYLEKPYLTNKFPRPVTLPEKKTAVTSEWSSSATQRNIAIALLVIFFLSWYGFRIPTRLTALVADHHTAQFPAETILETQPTELPFTAANNNLGMLFFHFKPLKEEDIILRKIPHGSDTDQSLIVSVFDESGKEVATNNYSLYQIWESRFHPVGLPLITDSAGKKYTVKLFISSSNAMQRVALMNSGITFRSVYFFGKSELLKNPQLLISLLSQKIVQPFTEKETQQILLFISPLLIALIFLTSKSLNRKV